MEISFCKEGWISFYCPCKGVEQALTAGLPTRPSRSFTISKASSMASMSFLRCSAEFRTELEREGNPGAVRAISLAPVEFMPFKMRLISVSSTVDVEIEHCERFGTRGAMILIRGRKYLSYAVETI